MSRRPIRLIRFLTLKNPERQLHQFTHGGTQGGHLGFASGQQTLIQRANMGVVAGGDDGGHVQGGADAGCPGFGEPGSAVEAAAGLAFDGNQAQEGRGLIGGLERPAPQDRYPALGGFLAHGRDREQPRHDGG